jgi:hypothetical protein
MHLLACAPPPNNKPPACPRHHRLQGNQLVSVLTSLAAMAPGETWLPAACLSCCWGFVAGPGPDPLQTVLLLLLPPVGYRGQQQRRPVVGQQADACRPARRRAVGCRPPDELTDRLLAYAGVKLLGDSGASSASASDSGSSDLEPDATGGGGPVRQHWAGASLAEDRQRVRMVSQLLGALASLGYAGDSELIGAWAGELWARLPAAEAEQLVQVLWALARLREPLQPAVAQQLLARLGEGLAHVGPRRRLLLLWALARHRLRPPEAWMGSYWEVAAADLGSADAPGEAARGAERGGERGGGGGAAAGGVAARGGLRPRPCPDASPCPRRTCRCLRAAGGLCAPAAAAAS